MIYDSGLVRNRQLQGNKPNCLGKDGKSIMNNSKRVPALSYFNLTSNGTKMIKSPEGTCIYNNSIDNNTEQKLYIYICSYFGVIVVVVVVVFVCYFAGLFVCFL